MVDPPTPPGRVATAVRSLKDKLARKDVLRAAVDVFAERGVAATRVEDLLVGAGIARRTFYKRFRSKEDVLSGLYSHVTQELLLGLLEARTQGDEPLSGLRDALDFYLHFHAANHAILRVLVEEAIRSESALAPLRRTLREQLVRVLGEVFADATGREVEPFVFLALVSGLEGLSLELLQRSPPSHEEIARARAAITGLLEASLRAHDVLPGVDRPEK